MTSQLFSNLHRFESEAIAAIGKKLGVKPTSPRLFQEIILILNEAAGKGALTRQLAAYVRLAIKADPYSPQIAVLLDLHGRILRMLAEKEMPALTATLRACRERGLPVPLIISCEKYLPTARTLQGQMRHIYYGIDPIVIRGDAALSEETFAAPVLSLPVADSYEALPVKIFEAFSYIHALDPKCGVIKIDDDLKPVAHFTPNLALSQAVFNYADYLGIPVYSILHDRLWHHGKCSQPIPPVYGKPIKSTYARGALYYLSHHALQKLATHYARFPGSLDGERYEDKAVGDVLFDNGTLLMQHVLEKTLGLDSSFQQDRG